MTEALSTPAAIAEGLGLTLNGPPPSRDPEKSWRFWQLYKCVKPSKYAPVVMYGYICSKTRVPFFEMTHHTVLVRAPSILPDNLQQSWIQWSYPDVSFWPPATR